MPTFPSVSELVIFAGGTLAHLGLGALLPILVRYCLGREIDTFIDLTRQSFLAASAWLGAVCLGSLIVLVAALAGSTRILSLLLITWGLAALFIAVAILWYYIESFLIQRRIKRLLRDAWKEKQR